MALLLGAAKAERFCDGALLVFFKNGSILCGLRRIEELDGRSEYSAFGNEKGEISER